MNKDQRLVLIVGLIGFAIFAVFPPFVGNDPFAATILSAGTSRFQINWPALLLIWLGIAAITGALWLVYWRKP